MMIIAFGKPLDTLPVLPTLLYLILATWMASHCDAQAAGEEADKAGMSASVFNLAKNILGAGMLSLPSGVAAFSDSRYVHTYRSHPGP